MAVVRLHHRAPRASAPLAFCSHSSTAERRPCSADVGGSAPPGSSTFGPSSKRQDTSPRSLRSPCESGWTGHFFRVCRQLSVTRASNADQWGWESLQARQFPPRGASRSGSCLLNGDTVVQVHPRRPFAPLGKNTVGRGPNAEQSRWESGAGHHFRKANPQGADTRLKRAGRHPSLGFETSVFLFRRVNRARPGTRWKRVGSAMPVVKRDHRPPPISPGE